MCFHNHSLLLNFDTDAGDEQESYVRQLYRAIYLTGELDSPLDATGIAPSYGIHRLHDGELAIFRESQCEHAFKMRTPRNPTKNENPTSNLDIDCENNNPKTKRVQKPDIARLRGVKCIKPLLTLDVYTSKCYLLLEPKGNRFFLRKRVYVSFEPFYFVFLVKNNVKQGEPFAQWSFVTAYLNSNRSYFERSIYNKGKPLLDGGTSTLIATTRCR